MNPASTLAALQRSIASLADRISSLPRRFAVSQGSLADETLLREDGLAAAGREAAFDCGCLASRLAKALEGAAEDARVRAAQLAAYATVFEREAPGRAEAEAAAPARALLLFREPAATSSCLVAIACDDSSILHAMEAAVRVRDGVDPLRCTVSGECLQFYVVGDNRLSVALVDGEGDVVESVDAEDVIVSISVEGASVMHELWERLGL